MGPEELARYRLKRVLGRGGRPGLFGGEVWEAEDNEIDRRVALKILRVDDEEMLPTQQQFVHDARILGKLRHPNVVPVHDAGEAAGTSFVVMTFVEGKSLGKLADDPAVSLDDKLRWLRQVSLGLAALHAHAIAHRDLKPENVLVRADGTACLVDLGVPFDDGGGTADDLDDQAAWATLARKLLGGDVSPEVAAVLDRAGAPDRQSRFPSMKDVAGALVVPSDPTEATPESGKKRPVPRTLSPAVAVVALAVLIGIAALVQRFLLD